MPHIECVYVFYFTLFYCVYIYMHHYIYIYMHHYIYIHMYIIIYIYNRHHYIPTIYLMMDAEGSPITSLLVPISPRIAVITMNRSWFKWWLHRYLIIAMSDYITTRTNHSIDCLLWLWGLLICPWISRSYNQDCANPLSVSYSLRGETSHSTSLSTQFPSLVQYLGGWEQSWKHYV